MVEDNQITGWVKIFRSVRSHWLWSNNKPLTNFEAWLTILIEVNHTDKKISIGYDIFDCKRGESINSLDTWAKLFNWNKSKVRRFFIMLQKDNMIVSNNVQKTTHITVCNYETYQGQRNANETQTKRKRNASDTKQESEELKNGKKEYMYSKFYDSEISKATNQNYTNFVKYLFGENMLDKKLVGVLSIDDQLTFKDYLKISTKCEINKLKLGQILTKIENDKKYYKGKTNLYRTLLNWAEGRFAK
jgi:hypothetical protein